MVCWGRMFTRSTASGDMSMSIQRRFSLAAATQGVAQPQNGSKLILPSSLFLYDTFRDQLVEPALTNIVSDFEAFSEHGRWEADKTQTVHRGASQDCG